MNAGFNDIILARAYKELWFDLLDKSLLISSKCETFKNNINNAISEGIKNGLCKTEIREMIAKIYADLEV